MNAKILISSEKLQAVIDEYRDIFEEHNLDIVLPPVEGRLEEEELLPWIGDIEGAIIGDDRFTERVLRNAPRLQMISRWGTGIDNIDLETCEELDITVTNIPEAFTTPVADTALAFILSFARQIPWADEAVRNGKWETVPARSLKESVLGVIGVGRIGKAILRRSAGFEMTLLGNDINSVRDGVLDEIGVNMVSKEALFQQADFICVSCDLNPTSRKMIGWHQFEMMKPGAVLINIARGEIIDEEALVEALDTKQIAGAGLDVFEAEPLPMDSPLRTMNNALLSPHNGHSSEMAHESTHITAIRNLLEGLHLSDNSGK
ncbi:MAG TPA: phosphoglycerate dehydrogenase [bacterium]|nr:phosphoglycerate dehydrogenase [bacterium]